jgi:hypothetical protein
MEPQNQQQPNQPQVITPGMQPDSTVSPAPQLQYTSGQLEQAQTFSQEPAPHFEAEDGVVAWSASEFISHEKNGSWFAMLIAGSLILGIAIFVVTREWFSLIAIAILAAAIGIFGNLRPRVLEYSIDPDGIGIGEKHFRHEEFRSFAVIEDGAMPSLQLLPLKRFMAPITMYLDPAQADTIIDTLGAYLPFEHRERDFVDKLSSRFRF